MFPNLRAGGDVGLLVRPLGWFSQGSLPLKSEMPARILGMPDKRMPFDERLMNFGS